jgi:hypothetical protein
MFAHLVCIVIIASLAAHATALDCYEYRNDNGTVTAPLVTCPNVTYYCMVIRGYLSQEEKGRSCGELNNPECPPTNVLGNYTCCTTDGCNKPTSVPQPPPNELPPPPPVNGTNVRSEAAAVVMQHTWIQHALFILAASSLSIGA